MLGSVWFLKCLEVFGSIQLNSEVFRSVLFFELSCVQNYKFQFSPIDKLLNNKRTKHFLTSNVVVFKPKIYVKILPLLVVLCIQDKKNEDKGFWDKEKRKKWALL